MLQKDIILKEFKERFGDNIRALRAASGLTGEEFSTSIGVSRNHLYSLENGQAHGIVLSGLYYLNNKISVHKLMEDDLYLDIIYKKIKHTK